jgi:hypothetical protein
LSTREIVYATLTALGLLVPWYFNWQFMSQEGGFDTLVFVRAGFANPGSSSLTVDLLIGCTAYLVWLFPESRRLEMRHAWAYLVLTFAVAFAFSFPLFLWMRERRMRAIAAAS